MEFLEELRWDYALVVATVAWVAFAKHPSARGLRAAVIDSLAP